MMDEMRGQAQELSRRALDFEFLLELALRIGDKTQ